jgi:hypothetical protein
MRKGYKFPVWSILIFVLSCGKQTSIMQHFPIDSNQIISDSLAVFSPEISYDGNGSLHFSIKNPIVIELYEMENLHEENCEIVYSAVIKTENWTGNCYLEMWCYVDGVAYFSRSLNQTIAKDTNWKNISTPFFLKKGQIAEKIKLNIVVEGKGDIWLDSIKVQKKI